jgi:hypothetical protein
VALYTQDCAAQAGRQLITVGGGGKATVLDVDGVGYVNANAAALTGFLGFPAALASRTAGQWIAFHSGDSGYQHVVSGVTLSEVLGQIALLGASGSTVARTVDGRSVITLHGQVPPGWGIPTGVQGTLQVSATGQPLPVSFQASVGGEAGGEQITFSSWGEPLQLAAPPASVPVGTIVPN